MFKKIECLFVALTMSLTLSSSLFAETFKVVLYDGGSPPLFFAKGDSNTGIYVDLLNEIGKVSGHQFEFVHYPTKRAMLLFDEGEIHVEPGINPVWRSGSKVPGKFTAAFAQAEDVVVFQNGKAKPVKSADDLAGSKVGTIKGFFYPGYMDAFKSKKIKRQDSQSEEKLMLKMASGRLDAMFIRKEAVQYRIKIDEQFKDLVIGDAIGAVGIMFRIHPSKASAVESLNSAIEQLKANGKIDEIYSKYR